MFPKLSRTLENEFFFIANSINLFFKKLGKTGIFEKQKKYLIIMNLILK